MTFKKWLISLMVLLLAADIAILLDIPVLRQVLGFLCFTTIPGLLILYALKLHEISFLKRFLLSVGLSLSFLIFVGLLVNTLLPWFGYPRPLSALSLVISLSFVMAILSFIAYWRNRKEPPFSPLPKLREDLSRKRLSLLLLPLLFPFVAIIGRQVLDAGGSNVILIVLFISIPLYVVLLMWQNQHVPKMTYPLAIGMISLSLLLARGLISNYLVGGDIYSEYHSFRVVSQNLLWSMEAERSSTMASLSISLLPAMFQSILGINPLYIYKVVLLIPISLLPVMGYAIYEKYLGHLYGFLSAFFYVAQLPFIYLLSGQIRVGIALISFLLAVMVLFDDHITGLNKRILFLIFLFSLVVEYYALPVVFLGLMSILWLVSKIWKEGFYAKPLSITLAVFLPAILVFLWWGQLTAPAVNVSYVYYAKQIVANLSDLFVKELRGGEIIALYTPATHLTFIQQIPGLVQRITFVAILIGVVATLVRKEQLLKFGSYVILMAGCLGFLVFIIILPWISLGYGPARAYIQLLVILAPAFILGCQEIANGIRTVLVYSPRLVKLIPSTYHFNPARLKFLPPAVIGVILVSQFFSSSYLYNQLLVPDDTREILDTKSDNYAECYIYEGEIQAAKWLGANNPGAFPIYMGTIRQPGSGEVFEYTEYGVDRKFDILSFQKGDPVEKSYTFLSHLNVIDRRVTAAGHEHGTFVGVRGLLSEYAHLYAGKNKIYASGNAEIYR